MLQFFLKAITILFFCKLLILNTFAQSHNAYIYSGEGKFHKLSEYIEIYEDKSKKIDINEIITKEKFSKGNNKKLSEINLSYSYSDFWLKFKIYNNTSVKHDLILTDNNPRINFKQFFLQIGDSIFEISANTRLSDYNSYTISNRKFISHISINPNLEQTYYLKISSEGGPVNLSLSLYSPAIFFSKTELLNIFNGLYYGIIATILLTSLLIWLSTKKSRSEIYNFWFFLYVVIICVFSFIYDGYGLQFIWPGKLFLNNKLIVGSLLISFIPMSYFVSNYFTAKKNQPSLKRIFDIIIIVSPIIILMLILGYISYKTSVIITFLLAYVLIVFSFILAMLNFKSTPKFTVFFISSLSVVTIAISTLFIHLQFGYINNVFQDVVIKSGIALMSILLTIGLSIRMRIHREKAYISALENLRKIKDREEKINLELEMEVKERTKLLLENKTKLETANKSIKNQNEKLEIEFKKSSKQHVKLQLALLRINEHKDSLEKAFKKSSSQHVKLQKALRQINEQKVELEVANEEIKESSRLKEIFLANTSHEIRTPLNAILGFTNLLLKTKANNEQLKFIKNIRISGENLMVIINDILDFSKIEAGKLSFESINFNIFELAEQLIETLNMRASEKDIILEKNINSQIPEIIIGDPYRLNQILINLLSNSIKFTNKGGKIFLNFDLLNIDEESVNIQFQVVDTGIGISSEKQKNIFDSFTQAESDTTRKYGGTGLGLSIVKQLIELQKGKLNFESEINKGTTFTFELKFKISSKAELEEYWPKAVSNIETRLKGIKILLVEDNYINQQLAFDTIKSWNEQIEIDYAITGKEAVEKVKKNNYNIVLMDIQMPEMDGIEATEIIRKKLKPPKCNVPIIAMTAHAMKEERETCAQIGMNDYITKPFNPDDLFRKIIYYSKNNIKDKKKLIIENTRNDKTQDNADNMKFKHLSLDQMTKLYKNNTGKISKIFNLYLETIPGELKLILESYNNSDFKKVIAIAHTLKTKMGYLGLHDCKDSLIYVEKNAGERKEAKNIRYKIKMVQEIWNETQNEINSYIDNLIS